MHSPLAQSDAAVAGLIAAETERQEATLELIASENIVSPAVMEATGSVLTNKYSEGYPGRRYYAGNAVIDQVEQLAIDRAKQLFGAEHANVQPHAGSPANMAAYMALAAPGDTILAMDLAQGGHLTHGSGVNFCGRLCRFVRYGLTAGDERIDMAQVAGLARKEKPRVIVAGATVYPRTIDFAAFKQIADEVGAYFMVDMAHIAGLVAGGAHPSPVPYADVVTTTTHKTLRGPRGGIILSKIADRLRPDDKKNLAQKIDSAVFPGMQGGPLDHVVAAKAVCFAEAMRPEFADYARRVVANAQTLADGLIAGGLRLVSGGTDNHLVLIDLTPMGVGGKEAQTVLDAVGITTNMNLIPNDPRKPMDPSGLRVGSAALTTRGFDAAGMTAVAGLLVRALRDRADAAKLAEVRAEVRALAAAHPAYAKAHAHAG